MEHHELLFQLDEIRPLTMNAISFESVDNSVEVAQLLIANGADVNVKTTNYGYTPLYEAANCKS